MKELFNSIETKLEFLWRKADDASENDNQSLSLIRIIYGLFIILIPTPNFSWIGTVPRSLFYPPFFSLGNFFDGFLNYRWLLLIDILLIICAVCLLFGIKARYAGITYCLLFFFAASFRYSFGKIEHTIMFPIFILGLSFTNWGTNYALIPDQKVSQHIQRRVLAILAVLLCFGMFTAGYDKALNWIDFDLEKGGFVYWFYKGFLNLDRKYLFAPFLLQVPPQIFEIFDYFAVIFELSPFIALIAGKKWWTLWLFIASVFHLGNTLLLNIPFTVHSPVYLSFIPLNSFFKTTKTQFGKTQIALFFFTTTTAITIHHLFNFFNGNSIRSLSMNLLFLVKSEVELSNYIGLIIWILTICLIGTAVIKVFSIEDDSKCKSPVQNL